MKNLLATFFLSLSFISVFGQEMENESKTSVSRFIDYVKHEKKDEIAKLVEFPFERQYPLPSIKNRNEFLIRYNEVFDDRLIKMIINSKPDKDWSAVGWRGIMFLDGDIWLDYDGRLLAVNYQSEIETKRRSDLIEQERSKLHESIKAFDRPLHILETKKYRIRIDDLGENNFRYASWTLPAPMSEQPDIVIENGEIEFDGTGGNHSFIFKNKEYVYECSIIVMGEDNAPPALLTLHKGEKMILNQPAVIIKK
ncbi:hypothetical protein [Polluticoccus soli]|uniref:hypothetical protein n=1 Tax=Polluticoccus soli TaxID=3034150 RepID=UPI0023E143FF|nr:hypothetical protein [Flavipsychrobacter sp. JY13-12]